jgi:outer membrane immunogenic protein
MKNSLRICAVMATVMLSATQAMSADLDQSEPAGVYDWSGVYGGVYGGYTNFDSTILNVDNDFSGFNFGGVIGGNLQTDQFVFGVEGDLGYSNADGVFTAPIAHTQEAGMNYALRARGGIAFDSTLLFVQGGAAWTEYNATAGGVEILDDTTMGYQIGAGLEQALTEGLSMRVDGLYTNYRTTDVAAAGAGFDPESFAVRVGLSYKF